MSLMPAQGFSRAANNDCESGKYCKRADGDCSVEISTCTPCTEPAPAASDPWRTHFETHCGRRLLCSPSPFISPAFTRDRQPPCVQPIQTILARTLLSITARRAELITRASQTQIFNYHLFHLRNVACNANPASRMSMAEVEVPLLTATCPVI